MENNKNAELYGYYNLGTHSGHVNIVSKKYYQLPEPYHKNSFLCCQCNEWTWRETELCIHCGYSIANYLAKQNIEIQREQLKITKFWLSLNTLSMLFILLLVMVNVVPVVQHSGLILPFMLLIPIKYFDKRIDVIIQREKFLTTEYERLNLYQFIGSKS